MFLLLFQKIKSIIMGGWTAGGPSPPFTASTLNVRTRLPDAPINLHDGQAFAHSIRVLEHSDGEPPEAILGFSTLPEPVLLREPLKQKGVDPFREVGAHSARYGEKMSLSYRLLGARLRDNEGKETIRVR